MKVSEIDIEKIGEFLRLDSDVVEQEASFLETIREAAVSYVSHRLALSDEDLDDYPDISMAVLVLCQDFYDNRTIYSERSYSNKVVDAIINMYARNLIG